MKSSIGAAILLLVGAAFLAVGWFGLTNPAMILDPVGIEAKSPTALNEIRATYGGMHVAMGLFFLAGVVARAVRGVALTVALVYLTGLVTGRVASIVLDGGPAPYAWGLLVGEALGVLLVGTALVKRRGVARASVARPTASPPPPIVGEGTPAG